ncbi:hypothetical protein IDJ75_08545 [Mucilaginibacter rigui]|uniref:Uncharacterized protein n=1 Tax=Mucilaginibacter rigui TaxID=534635 RepID=A0ABR7X419_9SPHI|nr:hypothetical protein [Mucilaginibacter rigui]MBD1385324.1 hypothetical protein [Mucilaginibacter rigui]
MATLAIVLKTKQRLSNNEFAVALRLTHDRLSKYYSISMLVTNQTLKFRCKAEDWKSAEIEDNGLGKFRKAHLSYKECNAILQTKLTEAQSILKGFDEGKEVFSFELFEAHLKQKEHTRTAIPTSTCHSKLRNLPWPKRVIGKSVNKARKNR